MYISYCIFKEFTYTVLVIKLEGWGFIVILICD